MGAQIWAFPAALADDLRAVVELIPPARLAPVLPVQVVVAGEVVTFPRRMYNDEPSEQAQSRLSTIQRTILHCLYTRHHDGRVRQRHLGEILGLSQPWVMPFVIHLVGEYVVEIVVDIRRGLVDLDRPGTPLHTAYGSFLAENKDFLTLVGQRVASYWDCYYRARYPRRADYPGYQLLESLRAAASPRT